MIETVLGAGLLSGLTTGANYMLQQKTAQQNQEYYERNLQTNYQLSQNAQRNAAMNEVAGLRAAGLSPVLANGAAGAPVPAAQGGTQQAPHFDPANALLFAQLRNLNAQTDQVEAQTMKTNTERQLAEQDVEKSGLELENIHSYNETMARNLPFLFKEMAKDTRYSNELREYLSEAAKNIETEGVNEGAVRGLEKYLNLRLEQKQQLTKELENEFDWQVVYEKYDDPSVVSAVAKLPRTQKQNLEALSMQYMAQVGMLAQTSETEIAKRNKIVSEIRKIDYEASAILHSDPAQMDKNHDAQGLMWFVGSSLMGSLDRKADAVIKGAMKTK